MKHEQKRNKLRGKLIFSYFTYAVYALAVVVILNRLHEPVKPAPAAIGIYQIGEAK